jgi:hypothetical protein
VSKFEAKLQTQVVQVSFLDLRNLLWTLSLLLKCWARLLAVLSTFVCDGKSVLLWKFGFYCECYVCIVSVERYPNHFIVYLIICANVCCVFSARWWSVMWILFDKTLYKHNLAVTNIRNRNNHFVGTRIVSNSLFSLCLHSYVLSSSGKLELSGRGNGERNKQQGASGYEAGTYFMALDISEKYLSQIQWPLEHF